MAAATAGYDWNRSSPLRSSPDTTSPMYPDRPIRPLPRRRLRDRMSPEQAGSIVFPPNPAPAGPLFNFPYTSTNKPENRSYWQGENDHHACHCGHPHSEVESEEDEEESSRAPMQSSPSYHHYSHSVPSRSVAGTSSVFHKSGSAASSVDGYESFENTNNKKKRKIPNMGGNNTHPTSLSAEMASMGISHTDDLPSSVPRHTPAFVSVYDSAPATPQQNSPGTGISGAGRGRFGRATSGRSERRVLGNSTNIANSKASTKRPAEQSGIISTAIANAQATPPHNSNENVSLLQQEAAKPTANKTQFTFTCGSDSANKMVWPGQENASYPQPPGAYPSSAAPPQPPNGARTRAPNRADNTAMHTQGTQTSPNMNNAKGAPAHGKPAPPPRKPRPSPAKVYAWAARKRRMEQEYQNLHNPSSSPWICEFCEYEDIFGRPPEALIRQYEIKDRKERKRLAEKRRLLEKARMKGRKGKKANKKAQNNANAAQHNQNQSAGGYDHRADNDPLDGQDDDFYDDYDDVPSHGSSAPPRPCDHPGCLHHHAPAPVTSPGDVVRKAVAQGA